MVTAIKGALENGVIQPEETFEDYLRPQKEMPDINDRWSPIFYK